MYDMGMDTISADQLPETEPDCLVCFDCSMRYVNGWPYASLLPDLGDVVICTDTEELLGMATNHGAFVDCAACKKLKIDLCPVYSKDRVN